MGRPSPLTDVLLTQDVGAKLLNFFFQKVQSSGSERVNVLKKTVYATFTTIQFQPLDIIQHLGLQDTFKSLQDQVNKIKNFKPEPTIKEPKSNIEVLSTPRGEKPLSSRKTSPRNPTPSAPKMSTQNGSLPTKSSTVNGVPAQENNTSTTTTPAPRSQSPKTH